ncbi:hypothetical protein ANCDUO_20776, partial [Ancylostoma duodenale]
GLKRSCFQDHLDVKVLGSFKTSGTTSSNSSFRRWLAVRSYCSRSVRAQPVAGPVRATTRPMFRDCRKSPPESHPSQALRRQQ